MCRGHHVVLMWKTCKDLYQRVYEHIFRGHALEYFKKDMINLIQMHFLCSLKGSNLLLQRLLVKKGLPEDFQLISLDSDANLRSVVYVSLHRLHCS